MTHLQLGQAAFGYREAGASRLLQRLVGKDWKSSAITADLSNINSYESSFLTFLLLFGFVRPGYDYLFSRKFSSMVREAPFTPCGEALTLASECGRNLGFSKRHVECFIPLVVLRLLIQTGKSLEHLTKQDLDEFRQAVGRYAAATGRSVRHWTISLHAVENVLYHLGVLAKPAVHRSSRTASWAERLADLPQEGFRRTMVAFVDKLRTTHRHSTGLGYCHSFRHFSRFLFQHAPDVTEISQLDRQKHIEPWLIWNAQRVRKAQGGHAHPISQSEKKTVVLDVKCFFEQITEWGWAESPQRSLVFKSDLPKVDYLLPRYIPKEQEERLMEGVRTLEDPVQRYGLLILRATGMRIGELVDLELDCVHHVPGKGAWLKVPLGKLHTERMVPLDDETLAFLDAVVELRGIQKPLPHPLTGAPTEFLFVIRGKRVSREYIRDGLAKAVSKAGLLDQDGTPLRITPHQLRHSYATALVNAGVSIQALMHLLGHVTMEMSLRYGHLFDSTVRQQYEQALEKVKRQYAPDMYELPVIQPKPPCASIPPAASDWMEEHTLKTRLAHGYYQRQLHEQACPYANICEGCSSFVPLPEARPVFQQQLQDARLLVKDAVARGWDGEVERHKALVGRLESLLATIRSISRITGIEGQGRVDRQVRSTGLLLRHGVHVAGQPEPATGNLVG
jgi:site-specific recombinase XerD